MSSGVHKHEKRPLRSCRRKRNIGQKMINVSGSLSSRGKRRYGTEDTVDRKSLLYPCQECRISMALFYRHFEFLCFFLLRSFYEGTKITGDVNCSPSMCYSQNSSQGKTEVPNAISRKHLTLRRSAISAQESVLCCEVREILCNSGLLPVSSPQFPPPLSLHSTC